MATRLCKPKREWQVLVCFWSIFLSSFGRKQLFWGGLIFFPCVEYFVSLQTVSPTWQLLQHNEVRPFVPRIITLRRTRTLEYGQQRTSSSISSSMCAAVHWSANASLGTLGTLDVLDSLASTLPVLPVPCSHHGARARAPLAPLLLSLVVLGHVAAASAQFEIKD
jgi:hypothetical protein